MAQYSHLFLPLKVGAHFLRNRIVMAPVETGLESHNRFSNDFIRFYCERAENDVGLFIVKNGAVHFSGLRHFSDPILNASLTNDAVRLTDEIHSRGAKIILQLIHHGADADHLFAMSASRLCNPNTGRTVRRMPRLLISHMISLYALKSLLCTSPTSL